MEDAFTVADGFAEVIVNPEDVAAYQIGVQIGTTQDSWLTHNLVTTAKSIAAQTYDPIGVYLLDAILCGLERASRIPGLEVEGKRYRGYFAHKTNTGTIGNFYYLNAWATTLPMSPSQ